MIQRVVQVLIVVPDTASPCSEQSQQTRFAMASGETQERVSASGIDFLFATVATIPGAIALIVIPVP